MKLLTQKKIDKLDKEFSKNADKLINAHYRSLIKPRKYLFDDTQETEHTGLGRKSNMLINPVIDFIGKIKIHGMYPYWAMDIIEGIARLDWDSKPTGSSLKTTPLSVKKLCIILSTQEIITTQSICTEFEIGKRHAQRYLKACTLMMPYLIKSAPKPEIKCVEWLDLHDLVPCPVEITQLHKDLGYQEHKGN